MMVGLQLHVTCALLFWGCCWCRFTGVEYMSEGNTVEFGNMGCRITVAKW
jgi:hypothetical protein